MHLFQEKKDNCYFATRHPNRLCVPPSRSALRSKNSTHMCVMIYNKIPENIKILTFNKFKIKLHEWLIDKCYYSMNEFM